MSDTKTISIPADMMEEALTELRKLDRFAGMSDAEIVEAVLTAGVNKTTENQLNAKAKAPGPMTLEEVALWLDDLDKAQQ